MEKSISGRSSSLLIGGSGAYFLTGNRLGRLVSRERFDTPFGESAPISLFAQDGFEFYFLSRHGTEGYEVSAPFVNYRANIFAAKLLDVERIVSWSGPGVIDASLSPGSYMIPDDLLDFTKGRATTFYEGLGIGFLRQSPVFCMDLGRALAVSAKETGRLGKVGGTYACTEGPRLETPAEIRMLKSLGAHVVGMTIVPEVFLARELEICYHPLCYLTNFAEGVKDMPYEKGVLFEGTLDGEMRRVVEEAMELLPGVCLETLKAISLEKRSCPCSVSMERYRKEGIIGDDFRDWVKV